MNNFPSIAEAFKESWGVFKKALGNLFLLSLVSFVVSLLGTIVLVLVGVITVIASGIKFSGNFKPEVLMNPVLIIFVLVFVVLAIIWGMIAQGAMIAAVGMAEEKQGVGALLKKGKAVFWPMLVSGILAGLLAFGSFWVFFFPVIIVGFFLSFVQYEVVLGNKSSWQAIVGSARIAGQHFGEVFVRMLVVIALYIVYFGIVGALQNTYPGIGILLFIPNLVIPWYVLCYSVTLYKHAKERTDESKKANVWWMVALAVVGWVLFGLVMVGTVGLINANKEKIIQSMMQNQKKSEVIEERWD